MKGFHRANSITIFAIGLFVIMILSLLIKPTIALPEVKARTGAASRIGRQMAVIVTTFESTCSTTQAAFNLGDTVCAKVTMIDPMIVNARFDWVDPDLLIQQTGPNISTDGQTTSFTIPASGPNAKTGTWRVQITDNAKSGVIAFMDFTVGSVGGGTPKVATYDPTCTTLLSAFNLGDTVCSQVMMIDPMIVNARFDWVDPDFIIQQTGPNITANGQSTTFTIPASGPNAKTGTWRVQITNNADSSVITFANFTVVGGGGGGMCTEILCTGNLGVSNDAGQCGATVNYTPPTADPSCGAVNCSPPVGSFFPIGSTTVSCSATAGPSCQFTVTVTDTQTPMITCPNNIVVVAPTPGQTTAIVNYPAPVVVDNCSVTALCTPASGSAFPLGVTTVTCTATDASNNTATCSFTVSLFDICLQNDSGSSATLLFNSATGDYIFCCGALTLQGKGTVTKKGGEISLQDNPADRRVLAKVTTALNKGTASLQFPPGKNACTITDRNLSDNSCTCGG
jgi:subtilisin-like proprotein convertase family protein